jgi:hypothetical protein
VVRRWRSVDTDDDRSVGDIGTPPHDGYRPRGLVE